MKPIAEITDRAIVRRMLAHVGLPSDPAELRPARGPPELVGSSGLDDDQRWPDGASEPTTPDAQ